MQRLEVSGAVRPIYGSLGVKWLIINSKIMGFWDMRLCNLLDWCQCSGKTCSPYLLGRRCCPTHRRVDQTTKIHTAEDHILMFTPKRTLNFISMVKYTFILLSNRYSGRCILQAEQNTGESNVYWTVHHCNS